MEGELVSDDAKWPWYLLLVSALVGGQFFPRGIWGWSAVAQDQLQAQTPVLLNIMFSVFIFILIQYFHKCIYQFKMEVCFKIGYDLLHCVVFISGFNPYGLNIPIAYVMCTLPCQPSLQLCFQPQLVTIYTLVIFSYIFQNYRTRFCYISIFLLVLKDFSLSLLSRHQ